MGFQSFRVELNGGSATHEQANAMIRALCHVKPDDGLIRRKEYAYYLLDDGRHKIEMQLVDDPVRLSCRFTLCHPPSVDSAFLSLIRELMERLGMDVRICDDVEPEHEHPFSIDEFTQFSAITMRCIAARRAEWIGFWGAETLAATTTEAHQRIILPRCEPVVSWPELRKPAETVSSAKSTST
jgi:hypothetical protein